MGMIMHQAKPKSESKRRRMHSLLVNLILLFAAFLIVFPFMWAILTAFKTYPETTRLPLQILPKSFSFDNFSELLERFPFGRYYFNTTFVAVTITVGQLLTSSLAAYAFARMNFRFKNIIFLLLLAGLMIPIQMVLIPKYLLMAQLNLIDTFAAIILPGIPSIFGTFLLKQQMARIPRELDESALIDGASHFTIFWRIILPQCKAGLITLSILTITWAWNDFLWPLTVIHDDRMSVLSIVVARLQGQFVTKYNLLMAAGVLAMLPMLVIFLILQRHFIEGVATTGMKD